MMSGISPNSLILEVPADDSSRPQTTGRVPKRVLHFSDGTLEEYDTDEEDGVEAKVIQQNAQQLTSVDPKSLSWGPWVWHQSSAIGSKALDVCDYLGESLAEFFGITTPKYQFEINHYKEMIAEEEALKKEQDVEMSGWLSKSSAERDEQEPTVTEPSPHRP